MTDTVSETIYHVAGNSNLTKISIELSKTSDLQRAFHMCEYAKRLHKSNLRQSRIAGMTDYSSIKLGFKYIVTGYFLTYNKQ